MSPSITIHYLPYAIRNVYTKLDKRCWPWKKDEMTVSQRAAEYAINSCCMKTLFIVSFLKKCVMTVNECSIFFHRITQPLQKIRQWKRENEVSKMLHNMNKWRSGNNYEWNSKLKTTLSFKALFTDFYYNWIRVWQNHKTTHTFVWNVHSVLMNADLR